MTSTADQYSPFQHELLNHLCQISTNVNTLIQVFVNLQSQLTLRKVEEINNNKQNNTNIKSQPIESQPDKYNNTTINSIDSIKEEEKATNPTIKSIQPIKPIEPSNKETTNIISNNQQNKPRSSIETDKTKQTKQTNETGSDNTVPLSLDSSDTDDESTNNTNNHIKTVTAHNNNTKKRYLSENHTWKHRNRFGLNRSKSSSSSASMSTLLRANHIRNHKYNGILKNKYKYKKKTYDEKSDCMVANSNNKHNPEHVFLSKNNRIIINVGGSLYETTLNTLSADQSSMLSAMFSGRFKIERDAENDSIFIDRDPTHFRHILNFLRDGIEYLKHGGLLQQPDAIVNELLQEAKYYNIRPLVDYIQLQQTRKNKKKGDELTHEKQYKLVSNISCDEFEDVFNKYTGSAGYDFEEWLFVSPYKTSRNSCSQPTFVMLFSKKLSRAEVRLLDRLTNIDFQ